MDNVSRETFQERAAMGIAGLGGIFSTALNGLTRAGQNAAKAADQIAREPLEAAPVIALLQAKTEFKANAALLRTADEIAKSSLDILA